MASEYKKYKHLYSELKKYATNIFEIKHISLHNLNDLTETEYIDYLRVLISAFVEYIFYYKIKYDDGLNLDEFDELNKIKDNYDTSSMIPAEYETRNLFIDSFDIYYNIEKLDYDRFKNYMNMLSHISNSINPKGSAFYKEYFKYLKDLSPDCKNRLKSEDPKNFLDTRTYIMSELGSIYMGFEYNGGYRYLIYSKNKVDGFISGSMLAIHDDSIIECIGIHSTFYHISERFCIAGYTFGSTHLLINHIIENLYPTLLPVPGIVYAYALQKLSSIIMAKYNFRRIIIRYDEPVCQIYNKESKLPEDKSLDDFDQFMYANFPANDNRYILTYRKI